MNYLHVYDSKCLWKRETTAYLYCLSLSTSLGSPFYSRERQEMERERERKSELVCVCVCVCEREKEREQSEREGDLCNICIGQAHSHAWHTDTLPHACRHDLFCISKQQCRLFKNVLNRITTLLLIWEVRCLKLALDLKQTWEAKQSNYFYYTGL